MDRESLQAYRVVLQTLGCAKNEVDSRDMKEQLSERGFTICEDPTQADYIILNTCAFIEPAIEESLDTVLELASLDEVREGQAQIVVTGCLPARFGDELSEELPEVSAFVPASKEFELADTLVNLIKSQAAEQDSEQTDVRLKALDEYKNNGEFVSQERPSTDAQQPTVSKTESEPWAYVKISEGCSRHCSYCTIPAIRGPYRSFPFARIKAEVERLVQRGRREIILVGQDTGIWSEPSTTESKVEQRPAPQNLAQLLATLAQAYTSTWFRVMYVQPEGVSDELLEVMAQYNNIASYLDIPLQHASEHILSAMNRRGSGAEYLELVRRIRTRVPNIVLRTTLIAGFPGEKRKDADELKSFLEEARFEYVGIFPYSREEGTTAAGLPRQIKKKTALLRVQALRDLADSIGFEKAEQCVGTEVDLLLCGRDEEGLFGRIQGQAPEVDGITYLHVSDEQERACEESTLKPGMVIRARIVESILYDLYAEVCE